MFEAMAPRTVSRDEFDLYDSIKMLATIAFFLFAKILALGQCGRKIARKNRSQATHRLGKKSLLGAFCIIIVAIFAMKEKKHMKHIKRRIRHNMNFTRFEDLPMPMEDMPEINPDVPPMFRDIFMAKMTNMTNVTNMTQPETEEAQKRNLAEVQNFIEEYPNNVPPMLKTEERDCF